MTDFNFIHLAIPFFMLSIVIEVVVARMVRRDVYRLDDSIASLSCGAIQQALDAISKLAGASIYVVVYQFGHVFDLAAMAWPTWVLAFLGQDLLYYAFHRASHRVNLLWGAHIPHHQSEEYNLTTALRQGGVESWFNTLFYLPLALFGIPPLVLLVVFQLSAIYQFWPHTRLIGKLGPLEAILVTPSHHRVHHAKNPRYIDKNFGAVLIIWDRLWGTYHVEDDHDAVVYGTVHPFRSRNPIWAQVAHWLALARQTTLTPAWADKVRLWLKPPGWDPAHPLSEPDIPAVSAATYATFRPVLPKSLRLYAFVQFLPAFGGYAAILNGHGEPGPRLLALIMAGTLVTLGTVGGILDRRAWAIPAEMVRLVALAAAVALVPGLPMGLRAGLTGLILLMALWFRYNRAAFAPAAGNQGMTPAV